MFGELRLHPVVKIRHQLFAVLLVKAQSGLRRQAPFLSLRIIPVDLAQGFQDKTTFLREMDYDIDELSSRVRNMLRTA